MALSGIVVPSGRKKSPKNPGRGRRFVSSVKQNGDVGGRGRISAILFQ
jgi:hypothetical protein